MLTWKEAHRLGITASSRALRGHDMATGAPVNLLAIAHREGIVVHFMPIPSLAGAYVAETAVSPAGIMINTRLPSSKQRYTLGHELGHHFFGHGSRTDLEVDHLAGSSGGPTMSDEEKVAEAFAAWVLMPRREVAAAIERLGCSNNLTPDAVYRLSLLLGSSYQAMATHLSNVAQLSWSRVQALKKVQPKAIKAGILGEIPITAGRSDVHLVDALRLPRHDVQGGDIITFGASAPVGFDPELFHPAALAEGNEVRCLVVQPGDAVNPIRPTTLATIDTIDGTVQVCIHHALQGVSEEWFE